METFILIERYIRSCKLINRVAEDDIIKMMLEFPTLVETKPFIDAPIDFVQD